MSKSDSAGSCRIALLILPSFNAMATMALTDPFRAANYLSARPLYRWSVESVRGVRHRLPLVDAVGGSH